ncbi:MAG: carbohydrate-binding domain-containing protein [Pirellula sp.]
MPNVGVIPGYHQTEWLYVDGYFEFASPAPSGSGSLIIVRAAGATGEESMQLSISGTPVQNWQNVSGNTTNRVFRTVSYRASQTVSPDEIRIAFTNNGVSQTGADKNLNIDSIAT